MHTHTLVRAHVFAFAHLCVSVCACVFMCSCICRHTTVFPNRLPLLFCFVSFSSSHSWQETNTGSLCPPRSSFRSRGSGGWRGAVQECQALFRKLGFCFVSLLHRSCLLFLSAFSHKQALGQSVLSPLFFLPFVFLHGTM